MYRSNAIVFVPVEEAIREARHARETANRQYGQKLEAEEEEEVLLLGAEKTESQNQT